MFDCLLCKVNKTPSFREENEFQVLNKHSLTSVGINGLHNRGVQLWQRGDNKPRENLSYTLHSPSSLPISFGTELHLCLELTVKRGMETQNEEMLDDIVQKKKKNEQHSFFFQAQAYAVVMGRICVMTMNLSKVVVLRKTSYNFPYCTKPKSFNNHIFIF